MHDVPVSRSSGTVVAAHGRHYLVELDDGERLDCFPRSKKSEVACGDRVEIERPPARRQEVVVQGLADRHLPKAGARALYEDVTPPPTPEQQALIDLLRLARPRRVEAGSPDKRDRRELRRLKEGQE